MGKPAKQWSPGEFEALEVAPAVSTDITRTHLCAPFGRVMNDTGFVIGTDGHRLHAVACEAWHVYKRDNAPPAEQVIPWESKWLGEISVPGLEEARVFPAKWDVSLEISPYPTVNLCHVRVPKGSGKKQTHVHPFGRGGVRVEWIKLEGLTFDLGIHLPYLLDAIDFVGTGLVNVWGGASKSAALQPIIFTASGVKDLRQAKRLALVMPRRI